MGGEEQAGDFENLINDLEEISEELQVTKDSEAEARRELAATAELLKAEEELRELREVDLVAAHKLLQAHEMEIEQLRKADFELQRLHERSARIEIEERLQAALKRKQANRLA